MGFLHVGQGSRCSNEQSQSMTQPSRTISLTFRPSEDGEPLLSVQVNRATRGEVLEALGNLGRVAKAKPEQRSFKANWVLRPIKETAQDELETFSMDDVTPKGLRALYP